MRLQGKTALVTGATSGIGQAIAEAFAQEGAHVAVVGRNVQRGKQVVENIRAAGGSATFIAADLASLSAVDSLLKEVHEAFGLVDILVNNAGIYPLGPTAQVDEATFDAVIATNLKGPFFLSAALLPQMAERGSGKVINITTAVAHFGAPARGKSPGRHKGAVVKRAPRYGVVYKSKPEPKKRCKRA